MPTPVPTPVPTPSAPQTAALPGRSVQDVRRGLDALRASHRDGSLLLTNPFMYDMTAVEFCARVVVGQHRKRQDKRQRQRVKARRMDPSP